MKIMQKKVQNKSWDYNFQQIAIYVGLTALIKRYKWDYISRVPEIIISSLNYKVNGN
jgi:hypothetical protein